MLQSACDNLPDVTQQEVGSTVVCEGLLKASLTVGLAHLAQSWPQADQWAVVAPTDGVVPVGEAPGADSKSAMATGRSKAHGNVKRIANRGAKRCRTICLNW